MNDANNTDGSKAQDGAAEKIAALNVGDTVTVHGFNWKRNERTGTVRTGTVAKTLGPGCGFRVLVSFPGNAKAVSVYWCQLD